MTTAATMTKAPLLDKQGPLEVENMEELLSWTQEEAVDFEKIEKQRRLSKISIAEAAEAVQEEDDDAVSGEGDLTAVILELSSRDQEVLQVAACLGMNNSALDPALLQAATTFSEKHIASSLNTWQDCGIIQKSQDDEKYVFIDSAQQDAYDLIPLNKRFRFHASVGRNLVRNLSQDELEKHADVVLLQFSHGQYAISSQKERNAIAILCLRAIQWSVSASDFLKAANFSHLGISLLGKDTWKDDYDLTLALYNASVEVSYAIDDYDRVDELVSVVLENARCYRDTLRVRATRVLSLNSRYRLAEATEEGLDVLYHLGERKFPKRPKVYHFFIEFMRVNMLLRGKTNEMILRMPLMTNVDKIAAAQMLNLINAYNTDPIMAGLRSLRLVELTMKYGLIAVSSVGFVGYSNMLISMSMDCVDEGFRYGRLALALLDKFQSKNFIPRVYAGVYGITFTYKLPLSELCSHLRHAEHIGFETGDIEYAAINSEIYLGMRLSSGASLVNVEREAMELYQTAVSHKQEAVVATMGVCIQWIQTLMGTSGNPPHLDGPFFHAESDFAKIKAAGDISAVCIVFFLRASLAFFFGDTDIETREAQNLYATLSPAYIHPGFCDLIVGPIITFIELAGRSRGRTRRRLMRKVLQNLKLLEDFSFLVPETCLAQLYFVQAALATMKRQHKLARRKYLNSIALSTEFGNLLYRGLGCERFARFLQEQKDETAALKYFGEACTAYRSWGATVLVRRLEEEFPELSQNCSEQASEK